MKVSLTIALALAVLGVVDRANAISQKTLDSWVTRHDLLDLDYKTHFKNRADIPPLTLDAWESFGRSITLRVELNEKLFEGCTRLNELDDDFFAGTVVGQPTTSSASLTFWATGLTGQITLLGENGIKQTIFVDKLDGTNQTVLYNKADRKAEQFPSFEGDDVNYDDMFPSETAALPRTAGDMPQTKNKRSAHVLDENDKNIPDTGGNNEQSVESSSEMEETESVTEPVTWYKSKEFAAQPQSVSPKDPGMQLMIVDDENARDGQPAVNLTKRQARSRTVLRVNRDCKVALVADSTFVARFGDRTVKQMVSVMADVQDIYQRNFGIGFRIGAVYVDKKDNLKLRNNGKGTIGVVSDVLKTFTSAVTRRQIALDNDICVAHLFTSRTFGATLGVAFVGSPDRDVRGGICSRSSNTGVSTHIGSRGTALPVSAWVATVAHEIGHGFGASHDESTPCAGDRDIMAAAVRSDGPPVDDFSVCSMNSIRRVLQAKATCLV